MKIIDRTTGKRITDKDKDVKKKLNKEDPIKRNAEKGLEGEEYSPMDPPEAYDSLYTVPDVSYDDMSGALQLFMDEHKVAEKQIDNFEKALTAFKEGGYYLTKEINTTFGEFFHFFDYKIMVHNRKEEKFLFQLLNERLIESGEHSTDPIPKTAIDIMEDDHIKFIQLASLTFNFLGLATRLPDNHSCALTFDLAYNNGKELVELLKLHIFKEDKTLFPLAHKLITKEEFAEIEKKLMGFNEQ